MSHQNVQRSKFNSKITSNAISRQDSDQQKLSEKQTLLEVSDLKLIEIENLWIMTNNNSIPKAQILFLCDFLEINVYRIMEKYHSGQYKVHSFQTHDFYNQFYSNGEQKKMAIETFKQLSAEGSSVANLLLKALSQKDKNVEIKFEEKDDDMISCLMHNLCLVVQGQLVDAFYAALKNIMHFGFHHPPHNIPLIPRIGGMQILIGLFDCFGQSHAEVMEDLLKKDLYFGGENLVNFIYHYYSVDEKEIGSPKNNMYYENKQIEDQEHKQELILILESMIDRLKTMKQNGIRHSFFLYYEIVKFYQKIHNKQTLLDDSENELILEQDLTLKEQEKLYQFTPTDIKKHQEWMVVKNQILHNEALTKKQEHIWINAAFKELYYDAIQMLGEKSIISDQNTGIALKCYNLITMLGEKNSIHVLYSLLCYNGLYKDILNLIGPSQPNQKRRHDITIMYIQCQIRHSKLKESLDELKQISKNRIEAYDLYLLTKCVFTQEEKDFLGALCVFTIMTNKSQSEFKLFDNLLLAKLLFRGGVFVQKNTLQSYILLKILLKHGNYELIRDYLCKLFIKKNLEKVTEQITKEQKKVAKMILQSITPQSQKKKGDNSQPQGSSNNTSKGKRRKKSQDTLETASSTLFSSSFYQEIVQFQSKDVKKIILMKIQHFKEKAQMQYITGTLKDHYEDLVNIGYNILFPPSKHYSVGNLISNYDFFKRKNLLKISILSASSSPAEIQALKSLVVKPQTVLKATQIFSLEGINYNILKYFYLKKTEDIKRENEKKQRETPTFSQSSPKDQHEVQNTYYIRVQKQLEQIEEKSEHSIPPTYNRLSLQSQGEDKMYHSVSTQQKNYIQTEYSNIDSMNSQQFNDFQMSQQSKSINPSSSRMEKKQDNFGSSQLNSIQQNEQLQEEGSQNQLSEGDQHKLSTQMNEQTVDTTNKESSNTDKIQTQDQSSLKFQENKQEEINQPKNLLSHYFQMQLDKQYNIQFSGKLMEDEILVFTNEDVVFTTGQNNGQNNNMSQQDSNNQAAGFTGDSGYGYFKFNNCQQFQIQRIPNIDKIFSDDFYPLIKKSSPFCLKFYGFYVNEQVWYVLSETYDEKITLDSDLSFSEIYQLYQITLALHLSEQCGLINYWGTNILYRKGGKLYLPNIISFIQIFHFDFAMTNLISDLSSINDSALQKQKLSQNLNQVIKRNEYAPEVFIGNMEMQRAKCDIWAIGAILFQTIFKKPLIQLIDNQNYIQEYAKLKNPFHLQDILNKEKEEYLQNSASNSQQNLDNQTHQDKSKQQKVKIPADILEIYLKIIQMSIVYDPEIRSSSEEISTFILQQFKMSNRIADKENYERFLEYQDNLIIDISSEIDKCKKEGTHESIFVTGNNTFVWINYKDCIVFYSDSYKNSYIFYNPNISLNPLSLKDTITGEGIMISPNNEIILGYFAKNSVPQNVNLEKLNILLNNFICLFIKIEVIDTITGSSFTKLSYDERGAPQNYSIETLLEKEVLNQIKNVKVKQQEISEGLYLKRLEESKNINYLALFQQFLTYWKSQKKMYEDLFGNKIIGYFDNNLGTMCVSENIPVIIENPRQKTIFILNNSCIILDHIAFSVQFFYPLELFNAADKTIGNYLNEIFCKDQPYNTTFMLSGLCFVGSFKQSRFEEGFLIFKQTNTLAIKYHPDHTIPYLTRINYNNQHFYEGYIYQGMYNGEGEYSNRKQILYRGSFENNFLSHGQIFFDGHPTYLTYEGTVIYDHETQTYMMHGYGKCVLKNKTTFEGQFEKNVFNGKGKLTYKKNKAVYEGFFRDGIREGPGIYKSKKISFEGEYKRGQKYNYGKQVRKNGKEIYEGEFKNDKRNGVGVLRFPLSNDIIFYQGEFCEDKRHGEGVEITRNRQKYLVKYYKDQCIRKKQVRLDTQECLFHFENEDQQKEIDQQYIKVLETQGVQDQNQDYPIQYYSTAEKKDQVIQSDPVESQAEDNFDIIDKFSPISKLQNNYQTEQSPIFQSEEKQKNQTIQQNPSNFYSIF